MSNNTLSDLKNKQEKLIAQLQVDHKEIYDWFVRKKIDLRTLGKHASNITSALALVVSTSQNPSLPETAVSNTPTVEIKSINKSELKGKSENQRAQLVWSRYGQYIHSSAREHNIDPQLIFATIMIESGGDTFAIRHEPRLNDASYGLGQLLYSTAKAIGFSGAPSELFDPEININLIAKYHKQNLNRNPELSPEQLTIAYNTGSPYKKPYPGHLKKFDKWYNRASNIEVNL